MAKNKLFDNKFFGMFRGENSFGDWFSEPFKQAKNQFYNEDGSSKGLIRSFLGSESSSLGRIGTLLESLVAHYTRNELTGAEREQNAFNSEEAEINRQFQSREAEVNRDWQEQFYEKYQSPQAMVSQYQAAGLNPAMMFGQSAAMPQGSASPVQPAGSQASGTASSMGQLSQLIQSIVGVRNAEAQRNLLQSQSDYYKSQAATNYENLPYLGKLNEANIEKLRADTQNALSETSLNESAEALNKANISVAEASAAVKLQEELMLKVQNQYYDDFQKLALRRERVETAISEAYSDRRARAEIGRLYSEIERIDNECRLMQQRCLTEASQAALNYSQVGLNSDIAADYREHVKTYASQIAKNEADSGYTRKQTKYVGFLAVTQGVSNITSSLGTISKEARGWVEDFVPTWRNAGSFLSSFRNRMPDIDDQGYQSFVFDDNPYPVQ